MASWGRRAGIASLVFTAGLIARPVSVSAAGPDAPTSIRKAITIEAQRLALLLPLDAPSGFPVQAASTQQRSVLKRHPVRDREHRIGFVGGFSIGLAVGDGQVADRSFDNLQAGYSGGLGAASGAIVGRLTE